MPILTERPFQDGGLTLRDLERAMDYLSEEQRRILVLVTLESMSYDKVANILDLPVGTVRSRLSRAREELRQMLDGGAPRPRLHSSSAPAGVSPVPSGSREQIRKLRLRAEEICTNAEQITDPTARRALERAAANYERTADHAEARLEGRSRKRMASG
jgi:sigma-70-like protein